MDKICWKCGHEIQSGKDDSYEHIIPESLGGKIGLRGILHEKCNNALSSLDSELEKQFHNLILMSGFKSKRNKKKIFKVFDAMGNAIGMFDKFNSEFSAEMIKPNGELMKIVARTREELDSKVKARVKQMAEAGMLNYERTIATYTQKEGKQLVFFSNGLDQNDPSNSKIGGLRFNQGIAKMALNFALYCKMDMTLLSELITYIKSESWEEVVGKQNNFVRSYHPNYYVPYYPIDGEISHVVSIRGDEESGSILVYVEIFNVECFLIIVSRNYQGKSFSQTHVQNIPGDNKTNQICLLNRPFAFYNPEFTQAYHLFSNERMINLQLRYNRFRNLTLKDLE